MPGPQFAPIDDDTYDLLALVADPEHPVGRDAPDLFLDACRRDAAANEGLVSVNRVRLLLAGAQIDPRRYSAFWAMFTGPGKPMVKIPGGWDTCEGSQSGNDGRPYPKRRWVGDTATEVP